MALGSTTPVLMQLKKDLSKREEFTMIKTKCTKAIASGALLLVASTSQAAVTELAINGGFETGDFTGWAQFPGSLGAAGQEVSAVNPSTGSFSGHLTEPSPSANIIKQANLAPGAFFAGQAVSISFDYRGTAAAGGVLFAEFFSELTGGGISAGGILGGAPLFPNANPDTWTTVSFTAFTGSDTSGGVTLQFNAACGADANCVSDYYIDNVSITADIAAVPVPAAAWLFGSALIGLFAARNKK